MARFQELGAAVAVLASLWLSSCRCAHPPEGAYYACGPDFSCDAGLRCEATRGLCVPAQSALGYVLEGSFAAAVTARDAGAGPDGGHFTLEGELVPMRMLSGDGGFTLQGRVR